LLSGGKIGLQFHQGIITRIIIAMDIHNPYSGYCIETFAGAVLPWHEKMERTKKIETVTPVKVNSNASFNFNAKVHFEERIYIVRAEALVIVE
jgi:hypothetical protein